MRIPGYPGIFLRVGIFEKGGLRGICLKKNGTPRIAGCRFKSCQVQKLLNDLDVFGLGSLGGIFDFEADFLAFGKGFEAVTLNGSVMDE